MYGFESHPKSRSSIGRLVLVLRELASRGIAVVAPPLDAAGNSVKAQKAIADISNALGGNPYAPKAR